MTDAITIKDLVNEWQRTSGTPYDYRVDEAPDDLLDYLCMFRPEYERWLSGGVDERPFLGARLYLRSRDNV